MHRALLVLLVLATTLLVGPHPTALAQPAAAPLAAYTATGTLSPTTPTQNHPRHRYCSNGEQQAQHQREPGRWRDYLPGSRRLA